MKRDPRLLHALLKAYESESKPDIGQWTPDEVEYHTVMLIEAKAVRGRVLTLEDGSLIADVNSMHPLKEKGYILLQAMDNHGFWSGLKRAGGTAGTQFALPLLVEFAKYYMVQQFTSGRPTP